MKLIRFSRDCTSRTNDKEIILERGTVSVLVSSKPDLNLKHIVHTFLTKYGISMIIFYTDESGQEDGRLHEWTEEL